MAAKRKNNGNGCRTVKGATKVADGSRVEIGERLKDVCDYDLATACNQIEGTATILEDLWEDAQDQEASADTIAKVASGASATLFLCLRRLQRAKTCIERLLAGPKTCVVGQKLAA